MQCRKIEPWLSAYLDGEAGDRQELIERHLMTCQHCRSVLAEMRVLKNAVKTGYEQMLPAPTTTEWQAWQTYLSEELAKSPEQGVVIRQWSWRYPLRLAASFLCALGLTTALAWFVFLRGGVSLAIAQRQIRQITHRVVKVQPHALPVPPQIEAEVWQGWQLNSRQRQALTKQYFVATAREQTSFVALYRENQKQKHLSYITADAVLSGFYHIIARLNQQLRLRLAAKLRLFMQELGPQLQAQQLPASLAAAHLHACTVVAVAARLVGLQPQIPPSRRHQVEQELALIQAAATRAPSPVLGYAVNYTLFATGRERSLALQQYYQAFTWCSLAIFRGQQPTELRAALLILLATLSNRRLLSWWQDIHLTLALYCQSDPDLGDLWQAARQVYGERLFYRDLMDHSKLATLAQNLRQLPRRRFRQRPGIALWGALDSSTSHLYRLTTFPHVGTAYHPRLFPSVLDLAIVLGHPVALEIAAQRGYLQQPGYVATLIPWMRRFEFQQGLAAAKGTALWQRGDLLALAWLYRPLTHQACAGFPSHTRSPAWQVRQLTLLTSALVQTPLGGPQFKGQPHTPQPVFLDPYPEFYNRLRTIGRCWLATLQSAGYATDWSCAQELHIYCQLLQRLCNAARRYLAGQAALAQDRQAIGAFIQGWHGPDNPIACLRDIYTLYLPSGSTRHLHAGIGSVQELLVLVPYRGRPHIARGGIFTFYETRRFRRKVTTLQWRQMVSKPGRAEWYKRYSEP